MPTLTWTGKEAVVTHHQQVPYQLLRDVPKLGCGDPGSGNLIVEGDNLLALKALLPYYAGQVKCIYIDPPYNTGNEGWVYNDNVNSPIINDWLQKTVGKEGEDLSRHDKWLCMMYPRLALLKRFLREDGVMFISIDDNEVHHLRSLLNDIFGPKSFVTTVIWEKNYAPKASAKHLSENHDYVVIVAKNPEKWQRNLIPRSDKQDKAYKNPDNDPRGLWRPNNLAARNPYSLGLYAITCPSGRVIPGPPKGSYWRVSKAKFDELDRDNRIWWGKDGNNVPAPKIFLSEVKQGVVPMTIWPYSEAGHTQDAKRQLLDIIEGSTDMFNTPKPVQLVERVIQLATNPGDLILDSFAGSGTTGHAVLKMNAANVEAASRRLNVEDASSVSPSNAKMLEASSTLKRQDAASTAATAIYFDPEAPVAHLSGNLPHWRQEGTTYFVTFRTADSMPREKLSQWLEEREAWHKAHPEPHDSATRAEYYRLFPDRLQQWLDAGYGACVLARPEIKEVVESSLRHFAGDRYRLGELVVMPNHVHVLVTPLGDNRLSEILHSWKSFTAKEINRLLETTGSFWQKESFDHIIRNEEQLERVQQYIRDNPKKLNVEAASRRLNVEDASSVSPSSAKMLEASSPNEPNSRTMLEASSTNAKMLEASSTLKRQDATSTLPPRRFIMVEMEERIAREVTAERVRRVAQGYTNAKGEAVAGLGGGFRYCQLGEPIFAADGSINPAIRFAHLARHVYFTETGEPPPEKARFNTPLIGICRGVAVYLLFNGILGDKSVGGGNILTRQTLAALPSHPGPRVIYAYGCRLGEDRLRREQITFRQTPYEIKVQ